LLEFIQGLRGAYGFDDITLIQERFWGRGFRRPVITHDARNGGLGCRAYIEFFNRPLVDIEVRYNKVSINDFRTSFGSISFMLFLFFWQRDLKQLGRKFNKKNDPNNSKRIANAITY